MKKLLTLISCLILSGVLIAQEKYPVPDINADQKHQRTLFQAWTFAAAGIEFAKSHGISPYEYGKYIGKLFAPSWGPGNDYDSFVKWSVFNFENFRHVSDAAMKVTENPDGSFSLVTDEKMWHQYFPDGQSLVSFDEFLEFSKGINEPIADHMGATTKMDRKDGSLIFTFTKKQ